MRHKSVKSKSQFAFPSQLALLAMLALMSCQGGDKGPPTEVTIFQTNDIHSYMHGPKTEPFGLGGVARLSTLLKGLRATTPLSLTLDAGDWSEGRWYFDIDTGANMLRILDAMGFDAAALGNHDFLVGPDRLIETINAANTHFPVLAANLSMTSYPNAARLAAAVPPYVIKTVNGVRIGIMGATTYSPIYSSYLKPVDITVPVTALTTLANTLRPQVDVLLAVSHNDFSLNLELAKSVPGLDAVISGHTHLKTPVAQLVTGKSGRQVPVVETGCWAKFLGELKLNFYPQSNTVEFKSYVLHPVESTLAEDPPVAALVAQADADLANQFQLDPGETIAEADTELDQSDVQETPMGNLIVKAYSAATAADLSLEETSFGGVSVAAGPVTLDDLHDVMPHIYNAATGKEWTLHLWKAKGRDLLILFDAFHLLTGLMPEQSPLGWLQADNVDLLWDPTATQGNSPGLPLVKSVAIDGVPLDVSSTYNVALTDGLLLGIEVVNGMLNLDVDLTSVTDTGMEAWRAIANYAQATGKLQIADLRVGKTSQAVGADLAVHPYGIQLAPGGGLTVEVENHGNLVSQPGKLECFSGLVNDSVALDTPSQVWTSLGKIPLPALGPQSLTSFAIAWPSGNAPGLWPIQCQVSAPAEVYPDNNTAEKVLRFGDTANIR